MDKKELLSKFKKLKTDTQKWRFIIENKKQMPPILLDNDSTKIDLGRGDYFEFNKYIGYGDGVVNLLKAIGIKHKFE